jgi:hypothetical protein
LPNWTEEIFTVTKCLKTFPPAYTIQDYYGEPIKGSFYGPELQKTNIEEYWIEKVIKRQGDMSLVKWSGYKNPEWILTSEITEY